jgi:hypothetical protein
MRVWRERVLCLWRGGTSIYWAPTPNTDGTCDSLEDVYGNQVNFVKCGQGNYQYCSEESLGCPVTKVLLQKASLPRPDGYPYSAYFGDDLVLYFDRGSDSSEEMPIIEIKITEGQVCFEDPGDEGNTSKSYFKLLKQTPSFCDEYDARYTVLDSLGDKTYTTQNYNSDTEDLSDLLNTILSDTNLWQLSYRRSILWKEKCQRGSYAREHLDDREDPVDNVKRTQLMSLITIILLSTYIIIVDPLLWYFLYRRSEEDINEYDQPLKTLYVLEKILKLIWTAILVIAVINCAYYRNWYYNVENYCCSDGVTNASFQFVDWVMGDTYRYNWSSFGLTVGLIMIEMIAATLLFISRTKENFNEL